MPKRSSVNFTVENEGGPAINTWGKQGPNPAQLPATRLPRNQRHTCLVGGARSGKTTKKARTPKARIFYFEAAPSKLPD